VRLPASNDTRLLLAGAVAFLALVAYLGVAFANTHATSGIIPSRASPFGPWTPSASKLVRVRSGKKRGLAVRVSPIKRGGYGALVPTLVLNPPPGRRFVVGLWLRGARPGRIGVEVDEFRPGATSVYLVNTTVPATAKWHHFTFKGRVKGRWLGLGMYVYRQTGAARRTSFTVRDLTVALRSR
jgi:hypothetical protein